jgi:hydrogenase expression/formation protein HypC
MCLAVPLKLLAVAADGASGAVDMGGSPVTVGLELTPEAKPGDYVLVHAGMAIEIIEESEAQATLAVYAEFAEVPGLLAPKTDRPHD